MQSMGIHSLWQAGSSWPPPPGADPLARPPPGFALRPPNARSYDVFRLNQGLVYGKKFELVICDEAHRLKVRGRGWLGRMGREPAAVAARG